MSQLFTKFQLNDITLKNRIAIPPMCTYSANDGLPNDWHLNHYTELAKGGSGLIILEATAVSPEGRITPNCLGIWNKEQTKEHAKLVKAMEEHGAVAGIQIAHAGIKANSNRPWEGDNHIEETDPKAWEIIGPSAVSFGTKTLNRTAREMTKDDIKRVQEDFVKAAQNALEAGYKWLELHFAHGYLAQSFFSTYNNKRTDEYGGSLENRSRFILETLKAVRKVWPKNYALTMRFGVLEFDGKDEQTLKDSIKLVKQCKNEGLDFISVSMGFTTPNANIPWGPAFMAPYAERVRLEANIPVASAWGFGSSYLSESAVANKQLDIVMVGRAMLENPRWPYQAAKELNVAKPSWVLPSPYAHWLEKYKII